MLQIVNAAMAILTIVLAGASLFYGLENPLYQQSLPSNQALDSNLRFMGGMGLGLAIGLLWITPTIENHGSLFRFIWLVAMMGGIGRLISMWTAGMPPLPMIIFTLIEIPGVPLLIYWQYRVAKAAKQKPT